MTGLSDLKIEDFLNEGRGGSKIEDIRSELREISCGAYRKIGNGERLIKKLESTLADGPPDRIERRQRLLIELRERTKTLRKNLARDMADAAGWLDKLERAYDEGYS